MLLNHHDLLAYTTELPGCSPWPTLNGNVYAQTLLVYGFRWNNIWLRRDQIRILCSALATVSKMLKCKCPSWDNPVFGFYLKQITTTLWYGVSTSGISWSEDATECNKIYKVFLNHHFTQQPIERGYKVWLTVIFIYLMDFFHTPVGLHTNRKKVISLSEDH